MDLDKYFSLTFPRSLASLAVSHWVSDSIQIANNDMQLCAMSMEYSDPNQYASAAVCFPGDASIPLPNAASHDCRPSSLWSRKRDFSQKRTFIRDVPLYPCEVLSSLSNPRRGQCAQILVSFSRVVLGEIHRLNRPDCLICSGCGLSEAIMKMKNPDVIILGRGRRACDQFAVTPNSSNRWAFCIWACQWHIPAAFVWKAILTK